MFSLRVQGLIPIFEEMLEDVEHRFYVRHLYVNFKKKFSGGTLMRDLMMGASNATYYKAWEEYMLKIKDADEKAYEWLVAVPTKAWCKHAFSFYPKCDVVMNSLFEAFNSTILMARDKPIINIFECIRTYLTGRFASLREKLSKYKGDVMPKLLRRLNREVELSGNWFPTWSGDLKFEITHLKMLDKFVVDLNKNSCSCNFWELVGKPCRHACATTCYTGHDPKKYVHKYYSKEIYEKGYGQVISPINGQS